MRSSVWPIPEAHVTRREQWSHAICSCRVIMHSMRHSADPELSRSFGQVLAPKGGMFGAMGERGLGGSKCGATAAIVLLHEVPIDLPAQSARMQQAARCGCCTSGCCA